MKLGTAMMVFLLFFAAIVLIAFFKIMVWLLPWLLTILAAGALGFGLGFSVGRGQR